MTKITKETMISDNMISFQIEISETEENMSFDERMNYYKTNNDIEKQISPHNDQSD
jgi:hypothetical protein